MRAISILEKLYRESVQLLQDAQREVEILRFDLEVEQTTVEDLQAAGENWQPSSAIQRGLCASD